MTMRYVYLTPPLSTSEPRHLRQGSYQDLIGHLLDLLGLALDLVFQFNLPALYNLQPFHLVLQSLPAILYVRDTLTELSRRSFIL